MIRAGFPEADNLIDLVTNDRDTLTISLPIWKAPHSKFIDIVTNLLMTKVSLRFLSARISSAAAIFIGTDIHASAQ